MASDELPPGFVIQPSPTPDPATAETDELPEGFAVQQPEPQSLARRVFSVGPAAVVEGITLGGADELAGHAAALTDKGLGLFGAGSGRPYWDVYEAGRAQEEARLGTLPPAVRLPLNVVGGAVGPGKIGEAVLAGRAGLGTLGTAAGVGAAEGALGGAMTSPPGERMQGALTGAALGTVLGVAVPLTIGGLTKAINESTTLKNLGPAARQAARRVLEALRNDDITLDQAAARLNKLGPEAVLGDVGAENVKGVAQAVTGTAGRGRRMAGRVLDKRSQGASQRVTRAIREVTGGGNSDDVAQAIARERSEAAGPLYDQFYAVGVVDDPEINRLIQGSQPLRNAIRQAKALDPDLADLPDNHAVLLDRAYKDLGGIANKARVSGDSQRSMRLNDIRVRFRKRLADVAPVYADALDTFSSESNLLDALEIGRDALKPRGGVAASMVNAMPDSERAMFKIGFADAVTNLVEAGADSGAARRLLRTPRIRGMVRAAFGDDTRGFREFQLQLLREMEFAKTAAVRFGSRTAPMQTEIQRLAGPAAEMADVALDVSSGASPIRSVLDLVRRASTRTNQMSPEVNEALGRLLYGQSTPALDMLRRVQNEQLRAQMARRGMGLAIGGGVPVISEIQR